MPDVSDMDLLRDYQRQGSEEAFAELVRRHVNLVYSAALRHAGIAAHAEEITQAVFVILARKAAGLRPDTILDAWLYETTRLPLHELFTVTHDSPQYNENTRQGIFYAESWLLTHYLMAGDNPAYRARSGQFTELLREGQLPEQAFTNALGTTLPLIEAELHGYLERGQFVPITLTLPRDLSSSVTVNTRIITPVEIYFRLGDELLRIDRLDAAESYFAQAQKLAPASPLPYEGLGFLAAQRGQHDEALRDLKEALQCGSTSFLAHYVYAREKYRLTADAQGRYGPLKGEEAAEISSVLEKSITLMPDFGPAHELLGFFDMVQGENLVAAEQQLQLAVQLEPENPSYLLSLAQAQLRDRNPIAARHTLEPLLLPDVDTKLRMPAEEMIQKVNQSY
jgi:tetratricopeptide (TPR) repeat protein